MEGFLFFKSHFFTSNQETIRRMFAAECLMEFTKINIIQQCVCAFACVCIFDSMCMSECIHLHIKWDSLCCFPWQIPQVDSFIVLPRFLCHTQTRRQTHGHMHVCKCAQTDAQHRIVDSLIFPALLFLIHLLNLPPPTHMHAPTHTDTNW